MAKRLRIDEGAAETAVKNKYVPCFDRLTTAHSKTELNNIPSNSSFNLKSNAKILCRLYSNIIEIKLWATAEKGTSQAQPPQLYPEYTQPGGTDYVLRELEFWTSGFFPGSLYSLLQRKRMYGSLVDSTGEEIVHELKLEFACKWWTENIHQNALLGTTHDLGFMIAPWAKPAWELNRDYKALDTMVRGAKTLHGRFNGTVGLIRSWDTCVTKRYQFLNPKGEFLTVIDNMMNLDLLFYVARLTRDQQMFRDAVQHARTTMRAHIREDSSTIHLVCFDPDTGDIRERLTNQGYTDTSCWTRGQAWAIAGFAETYHWTLEMEFLATAQRCADLFLRRLPASGVPPWDFDAAQDHGHETQPTDTSAAMIAAYGLLLIHKAFFAMGRESRYLDAALHLIESTCRLHVNGFASSGQEEQSRSAGPEDISCSSGVAVGDTILNGATINNHKFAPRRWANHGLVYADYYFMVVGNLLLDLGVGQQILKAAAT
ncbi:putative glycoside hydrolase family 88 protein [Rosellinia necatrix]|uniref:Putative glycoside hydrolase family 88 protein n=1 Tax=Rosellinia necatrix TaxID=77044 RepID=A0A1W2TJZ8_ROSNE|nr:putative glycoside hydrolase family 88 protein [Rosellinia necatrix]